MSDSYFRQRVRRTGGLSLREDLGIAVATVAIALTTLDRQSAGEKGLDAFGYGLGAAVVWQLARWAVRFLFTVPREMHAEALVERDRALARVSELEARKPVTRAEWMEMANEFKTLLDRRVHAAWSKGEPCDSWSLIGDREVVDRMNALCKRAGTMMSASPKIAAKLSAGVLTQSEPADRWLQFMREHGAVLTVDGPQPPGGFQTGTYESLASTCSRVCIDCSTEEI